MKYTPESTSKIQAVLARDTIKSGKKADKIVMCPVFINQEEERMFTKRANEYGNFQRLFPYGQKFAILRLINRKSEDEQRGIFA